jgi:tetratricopeptide (TPR) repeat protein
MTGVEEGTLDEAARLVADGRPARACILLREWFRREAPQPEAIALLGRALAMRGRHAEAIVQLRRAFAATPEPALQLAIARSESEVGGPERALAELEGLRREQPLFAQGHEEASRQLLRLGRFVEALAAADAAVTAGPTRVGGQLARAQALNALGRTREATAAFTVALTCDPSSDELWARLSTFAPRFLPEEIRALHLVMLRGATAERLARWGTFFAGSAGRRSVSSLFFIRAIDRATDSVPSDAVSGLIAASQGSGSGREWEWVGRVLSEKAMQLRVSFASELFSQERIAEALGFIDGWLKEEPANEVLHDFIVSKGEKAAVAVIRPFLRAGSTPPTIFRALKTMLYLKAGEEIRDVLDALETRAPTPKGHIYRAVALIQTDKPGAVQEVRAALGPEFVGLLDLEDWGLLSRTAQALDVNLARELGVHAANLDDAAALLPVAAAALRLDLNETALRALTHASLDALVEKNLREGAFDQILEVVDERPAAPSLAGSSRSDADTAPESRAYRTVLERLLALASKWAEETSVDSSPHDMVAKVATMLGDHRRALEALARSAELKPEDNSHFDLWTEALVGWDRELGVPSLLKTNMTGGEHPSDKRKGFPRIEGEVAQRSREHERMIGRFCAALEEWNDDFWSSDRAITALEVQGRLEEALRLARVNIGRSGGEPWALRHKGSILMSVGRFSEALETFVQFEQKSKNLFDALQLRGQALFGLERYAEAGDAYEKAFGWAEANPQAVEEAALVEAYDRWALVLSENREYEKAVAVARRALAYEEARSDTYFRIGYTMTDMGLLVEAEKQYEAALQADPKEPFSLHNIAYLRYRRGLCNYAYETFKDTIARYENLLEAALASRDTNLCLGMAKGLQALDRHQDAEMLLRAALALRPGDLDLLGTLVTVYSEMKKKLGEQLAQETSAEARAPLEQVIPAVHWRMRDCARQVESALDARSKIENLNGLLMQRGEALLAIDELPAAEEVFKNVLERLHTSARAHAQLGEIYLRTGRFEHAVASFSAALRIDPEDLEVRTSLARALLRADKLDQAETDYRRVWAAARRWPPALLGLGEVLLARAERTVGGSEAPSSMREEYYARAIDLFTEALRYTNPDDCPKGFGAADRASLRYLRGYARVRLAESGGVAWQRARVRLALDDFEASSRIDPESQRGARALERLREGRGALGSGSFVERTVGALVALLAVVVFGIAQANFLRGRSSEKEGVTIAPEALAAMDRDPSLKDFASTVRLVALPGTVYSDTPEMMKAVETAWKGDPGKVRESLLRCAKKVTRTVYERIGVGEYALLTFGAIFLLIGGAFLPYLTGLKFAGLQIEKTSSRGSEGVRSFGISRT